MTTLIFTIIIPHYSDYERLFDCLNSLLAQDFDSAAFEVIVIDDCSPKDIGPVLASRWPVVKYHRQTVNQGAGAARNVGIRMAQGRYLAFIDTDATAPRRWLKGYKVLYDKGVEVACGPVHHKENFLAKLTAITAFGEYLDEKDGFRKSFPGVNFSVNAKTMEMFSFPEKMGFAGEDSLLAQAMVDAGIKIHYVGNCSVLHNPTLSMKLFNRRAYLYGKIFRVSRVRNPNLRGYLAHHYFRAASGFVLIPVRVFLDLKRAILFRKALKLSTFDIMPVFIGSLVTRIVWATGVAAGYIDSK